MTFDIHLANAQARRLKEEAASLQSVKSNLQALKGNINKGWQATEVNFLNNAIQSLEADIAKVISNLQSLGGDINAAASQIKREEDEAKAALAAANQKKPS